MLYIQHVYLSAEQINAAKSKCTSTATAKSVLSSISRISKVLAQPQHLYLVKSYNFSEIL